MKNIINQHLVDSIRKTTTNNSLATLIRDIPEWYAEEMRVLGDKFRPIRWLPLDLPKIELDSQEEFMDFWDKEHIDVVRVHPCTAEPWSKETHPLGKFSNYYQPQFKGLHMYTWDPDKFHENENGIWARKYKPHPMFDRMIEQIKDLFPFSKIEHMYIWESVRSVYPHRDQTFFYNCPTEFRVMLNDENTQPTLYTADIEHGDINYIDLQGLDTNSFCWSNGSQLHGSDYYGKRKQLLCITAAIDPKKMDILLEKSISKYKDKLNYNLTI
jgi:hypothetical protein